MAVEEKKSPNKENPYLSHQWISQQKFQRPGESSDIFNQDYLYI